MSRRFTFSFLLALAWSVGTAGSSAGAQQLQVASRGPRFIVAGTSSGAELDASGAGVLHRRVTLDLNGVTTDEALKEITRQADLEITYSPRVVALERRVSLHARDITVAAALTEVLLEAGVDVSVTAGGHLALVKRVFRPAPPVPAVDTGAVAGRVTDAESGSPLVGATVTIEGTRRSAATDAEGRYRIGALAPGSYTVRARYIGYTAAGASVTVGAGEEATADFALARSPHELNQVVVTGTIVPTELKAVPTPISVIDEEDIALQRPNTVEGLFRQAVPGGVSWDQGHAPYYTAFSVRGASTLVGEVGQMKVFVDGIEATLPSVAPIDPNSVERIEVVRGPQAAAIYGSDAIGGVIQIFMKRGDQSRTRPQLEAEASLGMIQTPYGDPDGALRQKYTASLRGGGPDVSYHLGAGYSHTGNYLPDGELSKQSSPSAYGGMRFTRGMITLDLSGRYFTQSVPAVANPELAQTGYFFFAKPFFQAQQVRNQTLGARLSIAPMNWWQHTVTAGFDRYNLHYEYTRPRLTFPEDTLLLVSSDSRTKTSIGYNTSVHGSLGSNVSAALTAGFDHYSLPVDRFSTSGALNTTGTIETDPSAPVSASRTITNNTGYFAQAQLGFREALFLTAGLRAEENSNFGDSLGTPVSPRAGLAYVQQVGAGTLKLRGSWGRAIRPPAPGLKLGSVSASSVVLANPQLGPERQQGWDAGVDAVFGRGRGSLSLTYYDQTAENLIETVLLQGEPVPTYQVQNVARVQNTGVELEGTLFVGPLTLKGQYAHTKSRVERLAPNYTGDLEVGDQALLTPKNTAGASITVAPRAGTTVWTAFTYVGSWNSYDYLTMFRCFADTGPCQATFRGYITAYPGFVKANIGVSQQITPQLRGFLSVDNLTNSEAYEVDNIAPVFGRVTTIGVRFQH